MVRVRVRVMVRVRGSTGLHGERRAGDDVILAREVAELDRVARPRHLVRSRHALHVVLHHTLEARGRLERGARGVGILWVDELVDLPAGRGERRHVLGQVIHEAVDAARVGREAVGPVGVALGVAAREEQGLELVVLDVTDHLATVAVRQLAHGADALLGLARHGDLVRDRGRGRDRVRDRVGVRVRLGLACAARRPC